MWNEGGIITRRTNPTKLDTRETSRCITGYSQEMPDSCVLLEVSDTGPGLDGETADRIFDPYFSVKGVSRGLGLSGVLGIARRIRAGLILETAPNVGTTFRLLLSPAFTSDWEANNLTDKIEVQAPVPTRKILVVDDDKAVLATVAKEISQLGYEPISASSGSEAISIIQGSPEISAGVIDMVMPGLDGVATLEKIHAFKGSFPAIIISGFNHSLELVGDERLRSLRKPFKLEQLRNILEDILPPNGA